MAQSRTQTIQSIEGWHGQVQYDFQLQGKDTVLHGRYGYEVIRVDSTKANAYQARELTGEFIRGKKEGNWVYRLTNLQKNGQKRVRGFVVEELADGTESVILAQFKEGLADGTWLAFERKVANGQATDTLHWLRMQFEKGVPVGKTSGWDGSMRFEGQFTANGLLDGTWMFEVGLNHVIRREYRVYDKGRFIAHYAINNQKRTDFTHPGLLDAESRAAEGWEQLPLQSALFEVLYETKIIVKGGNTQLSDGQTALIRQANQAMSSLLFAFGRRNGQEIWSIAGGSKALQSPEVEVPVFPFSDEERRALDKGLKHAAWIENRCKSFYEDATVDMGRYSYQEVAFSYELIRIYQQAAREWANTLQIFENEAYKYIHRERLLSFISPQLNFPDSIRYEYKEARYARSWSFPPQAFIRAENLAGLAERLEQAELHLRGIFDQVDVTLEDYKRQEQLADIEIVLISRRDSIMALYEKELRSTDFNGYHAELASSVLEFSRQQFRQFASMTPEARVEVADATLSCFSDLIFLYGELFKQPLRERSIKEIYTRTIWNAYTFTDMEEVVKERLFRAYETELLPAITRDIKQHLACGNIRVKALNYAAVYKRMQELRETDTRQLERQLRKSGNVSTLIDVFEFDLNLETR